MSGAVLTADLPPPGRSSRLLSLVHNLFDYGLHLARTIRERGAAMDPAERTRRFGTGEILLILTRIALGLRRARLLEEKIIRAAATIDARPPPEPAAPLPAPQIASAVAAEPRAPRRSEPSPTAAEDLFGKLPTVDQVAAAVRRQPIGTILADICRDLGITRDHPLWDELHHAITEYGGSFVRLVRDRLNRLFPIAHILQRLNARPDAPPEPASTGPPPPA